MPHPKPNFNRMLQLIDEVFATRSDPDQLQVNEQQMKKLQAIHPATLSEYADDQGPGIWVLMIPTTHAVMRDFLDNKISEKGILERTKVDDAYDCIYLCSATTLPEYRGKGLTKKICIQGIRAIAKDHPIKTLFVWPFTKEGDGLAVAVAAECGMELLKADF